MDRAGACRAHRLQQAAEGFPLLRGCPSTVVLRRLVALDAMTRGEQLSCAGQLSDLAEAQAGAGLSPAERQDLLTRLPLVARLEAATPSHPDLRFQSVKSLARLLAEPEGIAGFARLHGLPPEAAEPPAPHVPSFEAAVPVPPSRLRKQVLAGLQGRFGGQLRKVSAELDQLVAPLPQGQMVLNLGFAGKGIGALSRQMDYSLWADLGGVRLTPTSYEAVWLLPAQWDLITVGNLAAVAAHLPRVIAARLALAG